MEDAQPQPGTAPEATDGEVSAASKTPDIPEGFIPVEHHQKDVNRQHKKYRDEERARKKAEIEAAELKKQLEELKAKQEAVEVPPAPDPLDDDFAERLRAREEAIAKKARQDAAKEQLEAEERRAQESVAEKQKELDRQRLDAFNANILKIGLNAEQVSKAANTVVDYGVSDTLGQVLLEDADGPLLTTYLASNPIEMESLNSMSVVGLIDALPALKAKAATLRPKPSDAPDPPEVLPGGGVREEEDPLLKGVIFE